MAVHSHPDTKSIYKLQPVDLVSMLEYSVYDFPPTILAEVVATIEKCIKLLESSQKVGGLNGN